MARHRRRREKRRKWRLHNNMRSSGAAWRYAMAVRTGTSHGTAASVLRQRRKIRAGANPWLVRASTVVGDRLIKAELGRRQRRYARPARAWAKAAA